MRLVGTIWIDDNPLTVSTIEGDRLFCKFPQGATLEFDSPEEVHATVLQFVKENLPTSEVKWEDAKE